MRVVVEYKVGFSNRFQLCLFSVSEIVFFFRMSLSTTSEDDGWKEGNIT